MSKANSKIKSFPLFFPVSIDLNSLLAIEVIINRYATRSQKTNDFVILLQAKYKARSIFNKRKLQEQFIYRSKILSVYEYSPEYEVQSILNSLFDEGLSIPTLEAKYEIGIFIVTRWVLNYEDINQF